MRGGRKKRVSRVQLPEEMIEEILTRLPVKKLLQLKCVCKLWKTLISKPSFRLSTPGRERAIVICSPRGRGRSVQESPKDFYSLDHELSIVKLPNPVGIVPSEYTGFQFVGSCNGLILFCASRRMYLWNPLTRCCRELTQLNALANRLKSKEPYGIASGLCYDKSSDDYKVVLVNTSPAYHTDVTLNKSVYVASLRKRENWTDISFPYKVPLCNGYVSTSTSGVLVSGHLHWIVKEEVGQAQWIVYFDEEINQFSKLPMPEETLSDYGGSAYYFGLTVLKGCLCMSRLIGKSPYGRDDDNDVFIMEEYGVKESWTKLCNIRGLLVPLHARISNDLVLVAKFPFIYFYHLKGKYLRKLKVQPSEPTMESTYELRNKASRKIKLDPFVLVVDAGPLMYMESLESIPLV